MELTWLVDDRWASLLDGNPAVSRRIIFPREAFRGPLGIVKSVPWALSLGKLAPDVAIDLQGLLRSGLMSRLSRARRVIGLSDAREGARWFFNEAVPVPGGEHAVLRCLRALSALGIPAPAHPDFPLPPGIAPAARLPAGRFVVVHPFARGAGKSLSARHVSLLCRELAPLPVILVGHGNAPGDLPDSAVSLLRRTSIPELIWLLREAAFVVSVDSGPMHIAAAVNPRLLSVHTWSDPRVVGPFSPSALIWRNGEIRTQDLNSPAAPNGRQPGDDDMRAIARAAKNHLAAGLAAG